MELSMKLDRTVLQSAQSLLHEIWTVLRRKRYRVGEDAKYSTFQSNLRPSAMVSPVRIREPAKYLEALPTISVMQARRPGTRGYGRQKTSAKTALVYFETRLPLFHTKKGLTHQQVVGPC